MTIDEARSIMAEDDVHPPSKVIEAIATVLRFHGLADKRIAKLSVELDECAKSQADHEIGRVAS